MFALVNGASRPMGNESREPDGEWKDKHVRDRFETEETMRGLHVVAWTGSLMIAGRSQFWPLAGDARYGNLGTGCTAPVSLALTAEQRVAVEDVLKADDGSDGEANTMALSASQDARPCISLSCTLYVSTGVIPIFPTNLVDGCRPALLTARTYPCSRGCSGGGLTGQTWSV